MENKNINCALDDEMLDTVVGGTVGPNGISDENLPIKIGSTFDNRNGYFYRVKAVTSIDPNNPDNNLYAIDVYFLNNQYEGSRDETQKWLLHCRLV